MSTVITIPLENNKDIAALVADKQPGDRLYGCFTVKAKDDQSLILRTEEITDKKDDLPDAEEENDQEDKDENSIEEESDNGSSDSESEMAVKMASPMGGEGNNV